MKNFLSPDELYKKSFLLAKKVFDKEGFLPDIVIALWRGGAPIALCIDEYLRRYYSEHAYAHYVLKCSSYNDNNTSDHVVTFDETNMSLPKNISGKILVVDDIFDSGRTTEFIKNYLLNTFPGCDPRIATVLYKPKSNATKIVPDYYVDEVDGWIVFPHELSGLTDEEIAKKNTV